MGNSTSPRVNSRSTSALARLGFYFSYSVNRYLAGFFSQKSNFTAKHSPPAGLTVISDEAIYFNSNSDHIVFPPTIIAIEILYSAPGELWNWNRPKPRDFPATRTVNARDGIMIPTVPEDVSVKDGYHKMTHLYGNTAVDCHHVPRSTVAAALNHGNHRRLEVGDYSDEFVKHCYICRKNKKERSDIFMDKGGALHNKERQMEAINKIKGNHELECANIKFSP